MKKTIAFALAGALAAGTALVTAANAQSGFSVSVGSRGYDDDYGWGYGYRPVHSWGGGAVVGAPAYGYYDAPAVTTTTRVVRTAPAYGYYDEPAVATTRTVVAQRPAYRTSRVVRSQKVVYRNPTYRTQRVVTREVMAQPTVAYDEPAVVTTRRVVGTQTPGYGVVGASWDDGYGYDAPRVTTTTRRVIIQPAWW